MDSEALTGSAEWSDQGQMVALVKEIHGRYEHLYKAPTGNSRRMDTWSRETAAAVRSDGGSRRMESEAQRGALQGGNGEDGTTPDQGAPLSQQAVVADTELGQSERGGTTQAAGSLQERARQGTHGK